MAGKPPETPPRGNDDVRWCERADETERIGPVAVARHVKDDGRALILYTRAVRKPAVSDLRFEELRGEEITYAIHRQDRTFLPSREQCPLDPTRPGGGADGDPVPLV